MSSSIEDDLVVLSLLKKNKGNIGSMMDPSILKYRDYNIIKVYFTMSVAWFDASAIY